jgi:hypothetical protein
MHAVEIANSQDAPVWCLTWIMYAAYQLHVWLKTVKIVKVYLVQQATLTADCTWLTKDATISSTLAEMPIETRLHGDFCRRRAVFGGRKLVESCAINT